MKANLPQREPEILRQWEEQAIFQRLVAQNAGRNGRAVRPPRRTALRQRRHPHRPRAQQGPEGPGREVPHHARTTSPTTSPAGTATASPSSSRSTRSSGRRSGTWTGPRSSRPAASYAQKWIDRQRESFKRLGVFGRWETPYATMSRGYEAEIVRTFARAAERGFLFRGKKPVYWCITDRTALAEAEVEYADHTSPSIHVAFDLVSPLPDPKLAGRKARIVIWTTTPWTLPANLAVSAHPRLHLRGLRPRRHGGARGQGSASPVPGRDRAPARERRAPQALAGGTRGRHRRRRPAGRRPEAHPGHLRGKGARGARVPAPVHRARGAPSSWASTSPSRPARASSTLRPATARRTTRSASGTGSRC